MAVRKLMAKRRYLARTSLIVAGFTVILTVSFIGAMAVMTGEATRAMDRLPYYILLAAVVFVATILRLEEAGYDGRSVLTAAVTVGVLGFILILLDGEGLWFALQHPDDILLSQLLIYFLAAATIATGLGYWGLRHWREFARQARL